MSFNTRDCFFFVLLLSQFVFFSGFWCLFFPFFFNYCCFCWFRGERKKGGKHFALQVTHFFLIGFLVFDFFTAFTDTLLYLQLYIYVEFLTILCASFCMFWLALFNFSQRLKQNPITLLGFCCGCSTLRNQYGLQGSTELTDSIFFVRFVPSCCALGRGEKFYKITPRTNDITKMFAFVDIHSLFLFSWFGCGSEFLHIHRYTLNLTVGFWVEKSWFWILILTVLRSNL